MGTIVDRLQFVLMSLWLGAMIGFGLVMAPALFATSPTRQLAGNIAGQVIAHLMWIGVVVTAFIIVVHLLGRRFDWRAILVAVMLGLLVLNNTYVRAGLDDIQAQMDRPIDEYAVTDPLRVEYNRWHRLSSNVGVGAVLLGLVVLMGWPVDQDGSPSSR